MQFFHKTGLEREKITIYWIVERLLNKSVSNPIPPEKQIIQKPFVFLCNKFDLPDLTGDFQEVKNLLNTHCHILPQSDKVLKSHTGNIMFEKLHLLMYIYKGAVSRETAEAETLTRKREGYTK